MTSQKMAAIGHKGFPYNILTSVKLSNFLPISVKQKAFYGFFVAYGLQKNIQKVLPKLDLQKGAKYCAKKHGRRWLEKIPGIYFHNVKCNFLAVSYQFLALMCEAQSLVGRRLTSLPQGLMRAPGFSGEYVQDPLTGYSWEHLDRPIGDLHLLLWGLEGSLHAFMVTIFGLHGPYGQEIFRQLPPPTLESGLHTFGGERIHSCLRLQPYVGTGHWVTGMPNRTSAHGT